MCVPSLNLCGSDLILHVTVGNSPELSVALGFLHDTEAVRKPLSAYTSLSSGQVDPKLGGAISTK